MKFVFICESSSSSGDTKSAPPDYKKLERLLAADGWGHPAFIFTSATPQGIVPAAALREGGVSEQIFILDLSPSNGQRAEVMRDAVLQHQGEPFRAYTSQRASADFIASWAEEILTAIHVVVSGEDCTVYAIGHPILLCAMALEVIRDRSPADTERLLDITLTDRCAFAVGEDGELTIVIDW